MSRRRWAAISVGSLLMPAMTVAQTRVGLAAATHVSGATLGLGGDVTLERRGLTFRILGAGSRPFRRFEGEGRAELGYQHRIGAATFGLGLAGIQRTGPGLSTGVGPVVSTSAEFGALTLSGNFSRFTAVTGSLPGFTTEARDSLAGPAPTGGPGLGSTTARVLGHLSLGAQWQRGRLALSGRMMRRTGLGLEGQRGWLLGAGWQVGQWTRVSASVGRMPAQEAVYLPLRNQVTFGLAFVRRRPRPEPAGVVTRVDQMVLEIVPITDGHRFRIRIPAATRVELNGDFTNWQPVELGRTEADLWETTLPVGAGVYHVNLRIDGGTWIVPAGLAAADDGFGGHAGVLRIP